MWGAAMGRETKFGLLIGLGFIVLFGVILSGRAGSTTTDHAILPTGETQVHATRVQSLHNTVDPFAVQTLDVGGTPVAETPEEPMPGPGQPVAEAPAPRTEDIVTVGFGGPVTVETPMGPGRTDIRRTQLEVAMGPTVGRTPTVTVPQPLSDPSRPVYVVKAGDSLSSIAHQFYGKDWPKLWQQIMEANKSTLKDPKKLAVGMKLVIPSAPAAAPKPDAPKTDAPRTDSPAAPAPADYDSRDTALATDGRVISTPADVRRALRDVTVPADGSHVVAPRAPMTLTSEDVGRVYGNQTDLVEAPTTAPKTYVIQAGDTFGKIAGKLYGDSGKFSRLLALRNPGVDPTRLKIGQRIVLLDGVALAPDSAVASR
jgi:nucleoid-associated protein YgaU